MIKNCLRCGKSFEVNENDHNDRKRKYCCMVCVKEASRERTREYLKARRISYNKVCVICDTPFKTNRCKKLTCGEECRKIYNRTRKKLECEVREKKEKEKQVTNQDLIVLKDREAKKMGMSYGQYDAWLRTQAEREARERNGRT